MQAWIAGVVLLAFLLLLYTGYHCAWDRKIRRMLGKCGILKVRFDMAKEKTALNPIETKEIAVQFEQSCDSDSSDDEKIEEVEPVRDEE